jgi:homocysteine S-methyltransferase
VLDILSADFITLVEVVPPTSSDAGAILAKLAALAGSSIDAFSVASNPVARPRMSALALCALIKERTSTPVIMHCTTRDHNRLGAWSNLCGAHALGIDAVLVATGDLVALGDSTTTTTVRDLDVFELVRMACDVGFQVGVVFDPGDDASGIDREADRLRRKIDAGARFAVTQPVYDEVGASELARGLAWASVPIIMGILPLRSARHAAFLNDHVAGISVPESVRARLARAEDPVLEGIRNAHCMLGIARRRFAGVCVMPSFGHYEVVTELLPPRQQDEVELAGEGSPG